MTLTRAAALIARYRATRLSRLRRRLDRGGITRMDAGGRLYVNDYRGPTAGARARAAARAVA